MLHLHWENFSESNNVCHWWCLARWSTAILKRIEFRKHFRFESILFLQALQHWMFFKADEFVPIYNLDYYFSVSNFRQRRWATVTSTSRLLKDGLVGYYLVMDQVLSKIPWWLIIIWFWPNFKLFGYKFELIS